MTTQVETEIAASAVAYDGALEHLRAELAKLDLLIQRRLLEWRSRASVMEAPPAPTYVSDEEVEVLLRGELRVPSSEELALLDDEIQTRQNQIDESVRLCLEKRLDLPLPRLTRLFNLSPVEAHALVACLAPELRRKYDRIYAYLQDDITRKRPSVDLVLDLFGVSEAQRWSYRRLFTDSGTLFRAGLVQSVDDAQSPSGSSGLSTFIKLDPRILGFILGNVVVDARIQDACSLLEPGTPLSELNLATEVKVRLERFVNAHFGPAASVPGSLFLHVRGPYGVGKRDTALALCGELGCPMLRLDLELLFSKPGDFETLLRLAFRESLLLQAPLMLEHVDVILGEDTTARGYQRIVANLTRELGWFTLAAGEKGWRLEGLFTHSHFESVELPRPDVTHRRRAWESCLSRVELGNDEAVPELLARRFRLTPGQIRDAVVAASLSPREGPLTEQSLAAACRAGSNQRLSELATKVEPHYDWADIVLPDATTEVLHEICSQVQNQYRVMTEWGFEKKLAHGTGLSVLFSGSPGTGKTMAAQVMAHQLQLDLYKIDLSGVVSKYIGETEKNLGRIFHEAETSNAVIFFDEADALFGKRTDVSDAHDRYANIEVSYLLQRMEEYDGIVILATNLRKNMDDAFTRRIRFIVDFPFPDEASRLQIWQKHIPAEAPVSAELDYGLLAKKIKVPGGSIKNIVLNAAFRAAEENVPIDMAHLVQGAKLEFVKIGKLWNEQVLYQPAKDARGDRRAEA